MAHLLPVGDMAMPFYCFADVVGMPSVGRAPALPADCGYRLVASPGREAPWSVYAVESGLDDASCSCLEAVSGELRILLDSAAGYPPAMALASRNSSEDCWESGWPTKQQFSAVLVDALRRELMAQPKRPFRLAMVLLDQQGYAEKGEFVWVLRYHPERNEVAWVSQDYQIYRDLADGFALSADDLQHLQD